MVRVKVGSSLDDKLNRIARSVVESRRIAENMVSGVREIVRRTAELNEVNSRVADNVRRMSLGSRESVGLMRRTHRALEEFKSLSEHAFGRMFRQFRTFTEVSRHTKTLIEGSVASVLAPMYGRIMSLAIGFGNYAGAVLGYLGPLYVVAVGIFEAVKVIRGVVESARRIISTVAGFIRWLASWVRSVRDAGGLIKWLGNVINDRFGGVVRWLRRFHAGLGSVIGYLGRILLFEKLRFVWEKAGQFARSIGGAVRDALKYVLGGVAGVGAGGVVAGGVGAIGALAGVAVAGFGTAGGIIEYLMGGFEKVSEKSRALADAFGGLFGGVIKAGNAIVQFAGGLPPVLRQIMEGVGVVVQGWGIILSHVADTVMGAGERIANAFRGFVSWLITFKDNLYSWWSGAVGWFKDRLADVYSALRGFYDWILNSAKPVLDGIIEAVKTLKDWFDKLVGAISWLVNQIESFVGALRNLNVGGVVGAVSQYLSGAERWFGGVESWFSRALNINVNVNTSVDVRGVERSRVESNPVVEYSWKG